MKTKIYEIEFLERWSYQDEGEDYKDSKTVSAKNAEEAIEKVRKHVMKQSFRDDDETPAVIHRVVAFELIGLKLKETLDL